MPATTIQGSKITAQQRNSGAAQRTSRALSGSTWLPTSSLGGISRSSSSAARSAA
jgi:hypothetical protein